MQTKFDSAENTLKSIEVDWKKREECLLGLLKLLSTPASQTVAVATISEIPKPLAAQFSDLRSGIVRLASETVCEAASCCQRIPTQSFVKFSDVFLREPTFYKALGNGNKTIVRHASTAMLSLVANDCVAFETIEAVFHLQKSNKIISIREGLAEAIYVFLKGVMKPEGSNRDTMFSTSEIGARPEESGADGSCGKRESSVRTDQPAAKKRLKSAVPKVPASGERRELENSGFRRQMGSNRLKQENLKFFEQASGFFMSDAAQNVRNFGKQIRAEVDKIQEALLSCKGEVERGSETLLPSKERRKELQATAKTGSEGLVSSLTEIRKAKPEPTGASASGPLGQRILRALSDETLNPRDCSDLLEAMISKEKGRLSLSLAEFVEALSVCERTRNAYLRDTVTKILVAVDISAYKALLLDFLVEKRLVRKSSLNSVTECVVAQLGLAAMVDLFLSKPGEDYAALLNRVFDEELFEEAAEAKAGLCRKVVEKVIQNVTFPKRRPDDPQFFEAENLRIFEKLMRCRAGIEAVASTPLDRSFLGKLQLENPQLHKFVVNSAAKSAGQSREVKSTNFDDVFEKSNPEVRRDLIRSLLPHIGKLGGANVNQAAKEKIVFKTLEIVRLSFEHCLPQENETVLAATQTLLALVEAGLGEPDLLKVANFVTLIFGRKDVESQRPILAVLAQLLAADGRLFGGSVEHLERRESGAECVPGILVWTRLAAAVRAPSAGPRATKAYLSFMDRLLRVVKSRMIGDGDTLARKAAVFFLVQAFFLVDRQSFERSVSELTSEQRALVMIYVQKEGKATG